MKFTINSASLEVDFVIRSSYKMDLIEFQRKNAVFGGTEYILVGYLLIINEQKLAKCYVKVIYSRPIFLKSRCYCD